MSSSELVMRRRRTRLSLVVLTLGTALTFITCKLNDLVSPVGSNPADRPTLTLTADSVEKLGAPVAMTAVVKGTNGTQLTSGQYTIDVISASGAVSKDANGGLLASSVGTGTIKVRVLTQALPDGWPGDTVTATVRVDYAGIKVATPADSITSIGDTSKALVVNGTDVNGNVQTAAIPPASLTFVSRDTSSDSVKASGAVKGKKNGKVYVVVSYTGAFGTATDSAKVTVHQLAKSFKLVSTDMQIGSLQKARAVTAFVALDNNGNADTYPGATTYTTDSATVLSFDAQGNVTALKNGFAHITSAKADGLTSSGLSVNVHVNQVAASATIAAGDAQTASVGSPVTTAPKVTVVDSGNVAVPNATVVFAVDSGGGSVTGATQTTNASGQANVGSWTLGKNVGRNTLLATPSLGVAAKFGATAKPGVPAALSFSTQPVGTSPSTNLAAVKVSVVDGFGNVVDTAARNIALVLTSPAGVTATLSGGGSTATASGVATFSSLQVNAAATGYTLTANVLGTAGALTSAVSSTFNIFGTASKIVFLKPTDTSTVNVYTTTATVPFSPALKVAVEDANGVIVTNSSAAILMTLNGNTTGATLSGASVNAVNGVATFPTLSVSTAGNYSLTATATGLNPGASNTFSVRAIGTPAKLGFIAKPTAAAAGATISPSIQVAIQDSTGATVTSSTLAVTLAFATNAGNGSLGGTLTTAASGGVATFANITVNKAATGYKLSAAATGTSLAAATSDTFSVVAGAAAGLSFAVPAINSTVGAAFSPAVQVQVTDANGNAAAVANTNVTLAMASGVSTCTTPLLGTVTATTNANGIATFSALTAGATGTFCKLTASSTGLTSSTSTSTFDVRASGVATKLVFTGQPTNAAVGSPIGSGLIQVAAEDGNNNIVSGQTGNVTLSLATNPGSGTLGGTLTVAMTSGIATFSNVTLDKTAAGYQLAAAQTNLSAGTSGTFAITSGAAAKLGVTTQPSATTAGKTISPPMQIAVQDANGNTVTTATNSITISLNSPTGVTGVLGGTKTVAAINGIASFGDLTVTPVANGYTFSAAATGLTGTTTSGFNITVGTAAKLAFGTQPTAGSSVTSGASNTITVAITDSAGNTVTSATNQVTLAIVSGSGANGASLGGTLTQAAVNGVATFTGITLDKAGSNYQLSATTTGLATGTSNLFSVGAGAANKLSFSVQPLGQLVNASLTPAVQVSVLDAAGNLVTNASNSVSLALNLPSGGSAATLSGSTTAAPSGGVATFSNLSVNTAQAGYTLTASATGITGTVNSSTFNIAAAAATAKKLVFLAQPTSLTAGQAGNVQVAVADSSGLTVTSSAASVTLQITSTTGIGGATLCTSACGNATVSGTAVNGVATFNVGIDKATTGYTLTASSTGLTSGTSSAITVVAGTPTQLVTSSQGCCATAGVVISPAIRVAVADAYQNTVTTATNAVSMAIASGGPPGTPLKGTTTQSAVNGIATFSDLSIDSTSNFFGCYTLKPSAANLASPAGNTMCVGTGSATKLKFVVQPTAASPNQLIAPAVQVYVIDGSGNLVQTNGTSVTVAIASGTGSNGATLSGTKTVATVNGVAKFTDLAIDTQGSAYQLVATATNLTGATSSAFDITSTGASKLAFTVQPSATTGGVVIAPSIQVSVTNSGGSVVTTATNQITLSLSSNSPYYAHIIGTATATAVNGVATFSNIALDTASGNYQLVASAAGLASATSNTFNVNVGSPAKIAFGAQPTAINGGGTVIPPVTVIVQDAGGNRVPGATNTIAVGIANNAGSGTLSGTTSVAASGGIATFSNLSIDKAGSGYTLAATGTGFTAATSSGFSVNVGQVAKLVITAPTASAWTAGSATNGFSVAVADSGGNIVTSASNAISVSISAGTGAVGATLSGTLTKSATGGSATFSDLGIDKTGSGYTLTAVAAGYPGVTTSSFTVNAGGTTHLAFVGQPANASTGAVIGPASGVNVAVVDASGNVVTSATGTVTMAIGTNPGGGTLGGTASVALTSGVASFSTLSINAAGVGYTLSASLSGFTSATSNTFTIAAAATSATQLAFRTQPSSVTGGSTIPSFIVAATDANGIVYSGFTGNVTVALAGGTGNSGAHLSGTTTVAASSGAATFTGLSIDSAAVSSYKLTATSSGLTSATSGNFSVSVGTPTKLAFLLVSPKNTVANAPLNPDSTVRIAIEDAGGNVVTNASDQLTLSLATGTGSLTGTTTFNAASGIALVPSNVGVNTVNASASIKATDNARSGVSVTSGTFAVTAFTTASKLAFLNGPQDYGYGAYTQYRTAIIDTARNPLKVAIQDKYGNVVTSSTDAISLSLSTNPNNATLSNNTVNAVAGIASFPSLFVTLPDQNYASGQVLRASDASTSGLTQATSVSFSTDPNGYPNGCYFNTISAFTVTGGNIYWADSLGNIATASATAPNCGSASGTTILASGQSVASKMVTDGTNLYWIDGGSTTGGNLGRIRKMALTGGAITNLIANTTNLNPNYLEVDGSTVYFIETGVSTREIRSVSTTGASPTLIAGISSAAVPSFFETGGVVYYYDATVSGGSLRKVASTGGTPTTLGSGISISASPGAITVIGTTVYVSTGTTLQSISTTASAGTFTAVKSGLYDARELITDGTNLYLLQYDQSVFNGAAPSKLTISSGALIYLQTYDGLAGLVLDGQSLYCTWAYNTGLTPGGISSRPK